MNFWKAIVLGVVQGLTEFLPVSSSGHLALFQYFFGIKEPQLLFDIMLHVGTLGAIILVFRRDIWDIIAAIFGCEPKRRNQASHQMTKKSGRRFVLLIVLGTIPTVIIAFGMNMFVRKLFVMPLFVSGMLFVTGIILYMSGKLSKADSAPRDLNFPNALIIGIAQGIAVLPGISRSGSTISAALIRGVDREEAARYSLLLSIPAILGAMVLKIKDFESTDVSLWIIIAGTLVSFVVGYAAIKILLGVLRKGRFSSFAYYCWGIAVVSALGYIITTWLV